MTNSWVPAGIPAVAVRMEVSISANLIVLLQSHELEAWSRYFLLPCHPVLRCVAWFEKIQHSWEFPCRWSSSLRVRQKGVEQQCYPC